jgi:photosystem II stability/assembly factor-like uncharacterized protein
MARRSVRLITASLFFVVLAQAQWVPTSGPHTGFVAWLVTSGGTLLAGTGSVVYRSTNGGSQWTPSSTGLVTPSAAGCINSGTGFWAGTGSGLFRSADGGIIWSPVTNGLPPGSAMPLFTLDSMIFARTDSGLFRSTDGGLSWSASREGLPRSVSNPARWSTVEAVAASGQLVFAGVRRGLYRSSDNGVHWERLTTGLSDTVFTLLAVSGDTIHAGAESGKIFRSSNGGSTWVDEGMMPWGSNSLFELVCQEGRLYAGAQGGIYASSDQGMTWTTVSASLKIPMLMSFAVDGGILYVGTEGGGVARSTNGGTTWSTVNTGLSDAHMTALRVVGTSLFAATYGGGIYRSDDAGESWIPLGLYPGPTGSLYAFAADATWVFAGGDGGVFHSTDGGTTWTGNNPATDPYANVSSLALTDSGLFAGVYSKGVFRSTDNGMHWLDVTAGLEIPARYNVLALVNIGQRLILGAGIRGAFISDDQGVHWTQTNLVNIGVNAFGLAGTIIYAGTGNAIYRSTDSGSSWVVTPGALPKATSVLAFACSGENVFAGTYRNGAFLSTDHGEHWNAINTGWGNECVETLAIMDGYLYAGLAGWSGGRGRSVWKRPLADILTSMPSTGRDAPERFHLAQNYPNPFNPSSDIRYQVPAPHGAAGSEFRIVKLAVYDLLGREVVVLVNEQQAPGNYQVRFDGTGLPSGVYFYRIQVRPSDPAAGATGSYTETKKMALVR